MPNPRRPARHSCVFSVAIGALPAGFEGSRTSRLVCARIAVQPCAMTLPAPHHRYTFQEYLEMEEVAGVRHEFYAGQIYAMAGGTPEHAAMGAAVLARLAEGVRGGPCRVYSSDSRVRVRASGLATYPDVSVVCGPSERDPESPTHVTNPRLIVEVTSPSTSEYDRGDKLLHYQQIPSLDWVVLVHHEAPLIELWSRTPTGWQVSSHGVGERVVLAAIGCSLSVDEVWAARTGA